MMFEIIALGLVVWIAIGVAVMPFVSKFIGLAESEDEGGEA